MPPISKQAREPAAPVHDHSVSFYRDDAGLADSVATFLGHSLDAGGSAIVIAKPEHRALFDMALQELGHSIDDVQAQERYLALDAAQTLASFTVNGALNADHFDAVIGRVLDAASAHGRPVHAYGEMVSLLWDHGNVGAALELESMWNELGTRREFTLMCAYAQASLSESSVHNATEVCRLHSDIDLLGDPARVGARLGSNEHIVSDVFVPLLASSRAARLFVIDALSDQAAAGVIDDAALIVTELASNAIKHAATAFQVTVDRVGSQFRISVEDAGGGTPRVRDIDTRAPHGRGLAMAVTVANAWGWDALPIGKSVWVEVGES